jgi:hypothetical protein
LSVSRDVCTASSSPISSLKRFSRKVLALVMFLPMALACVYMDEHTWTCMHGAVAGVMTGRDNAHHMHACLMQLGRIQSSPVAQYTTTHAISGVHGWLPPLQLLYCSCITCFSSASCMSYLHTVNTTCG